MASGKRAEMFLGEGGGHRWQRVPPNEKRGRVHTSTVTVAVFPEATPSRMEFLERDVTWTATRGSGAGGQHRNKTASAVIAKHVPSGLTVRVENERSQHQNRQIAMAVLSERLRQMEEEKVDSGVADDRRKQVGSGQRGDKIRTIALQRDQVTDHRTEKRTTCRRYLAGHLEDLI